MTCYSSLYILFHKITFFYVYDCIFLLQMNISRMLRPCLVLTSRHTAAAPVVKVSTSRQTWQDMREHILERNRTVVTSVGKLLLRKEIWTDTNFCISNSSSTLSYEGLSVNPQTFALIYEHFLLRYSANIINNINKLWHHRQFTQTRPWTSFCFLM